MTNVSGQPLHRAAMDLSSDPFEAIEFELRLDMEEVSGASFETSVRQAAEASGGTVLFEMPRSFPLGDDLDDIKRVAAVRFDSRTGDRLVFAALLNEGQAIRVLRRSDVGERFYGFAKAYLGILNRLQTSGAVGQA